MQNDDYKAYDVESVHTDLDSKQPLEALEIELDPKSNDNKEPE